MAVNKVVYGGETIVDLTADTVTAAKMLSGTTAHDKSGAKITGGIETFDGLYTSNNGVSGDYVEIKPSKTNYAVIPRNLYIEKPIVLPPEKNLSGGNIKSGVSIFGVEGTLESGASDNVEYINVVNNTEFTLVVGTTVIEPSQTMKVYDGNAVTYGYLLVMDVTGSADEVILKFKKDGVDGAYYTTLGRGGSLNGQLAYPSGLLMLMCSDATQIVPGDTIELINE